jgi:hypothetical protein
MVSNSIDFGGPRFHLLCHAPVSLSSIPFLAMSSIAFNCGNFGMMAKSTSQPFLGLRHRITDLNCLGLVDRPVPYRLQSVGIIYHHS